MSALYFEVCLQEEAILWLWMQMLKTGFELAQSAGATENTDCISPEG